jgi:hypothetical protein
MINWQEAFKLLPELFAKQPDVVGREKDNVSAKSGTVV